MKQDAPATAPAVSPEGRSQEFAPVQGGNETTSAGTLLVVAYILMWAILMAFLFQTFRRQGAVDQRLTELERSLKKPPPAA